MSHPVQMPEVSGEFRTRRVDFGPPSRSASLLTLSSSCTALGPHDGAWSAGPTIASCSASNAPTGRDRSGRLRPRDPSRTSRRRSPAANGTRDVRSADALSAAGARSALACARGDGRPRGGAFGVLGLREPGSAPRDPGRPRRTDFMTTVTKTLLDTPVHVTSTSPSSTSRADEWCVRSLRTPSVASSAYSSPPLTSIRPSTRLNRTRIRRSKLARAPGGGSSFDAPIATPAPCHRGPAPRRRPGGDDHRVARRRVRCGSGRSTGRQPSGRLSCRSPQANGVGSAARGRAGGAAPTYPAR